MCTNPSTATATTSDEISEAQEFYLDNEKNCDSLISTLETSIVQPTLVQAMSSPDLMPSYEARQSFITAQSQLKRLTAENIFLKRTLHGVRQNFSTLTNNLKCVDPNKKRFKYRDDVRNFEM